MLGSAQGSIFGRVFFSCKRGATILTSLHVRSLDHDGLLYIETWIIRDKMFMKYQSYVYYRLYIEKFGAHKPGRHAYSWAGYYAMRLGL